MPFPVDERWIREAEEALGRRLPDSYRERMMRDNGGEFDTAGDTWALYPVYDRSDRKRIKRTCNHLVLETQSALSWAGFPKHAVAIACNGSGDLLVLLPDRHNPSTFEQVVYLWSHETREVQAVGEFDALGASA